MLKMHRDNDTAAQEPGDARAPVALDAACDMRDGESDHIDLTAVCDPGDEAGEIEANVSAVTGSKPAGEDAHPQEAGADFLAPALGAIDQAYADFRANESRTKLSAWKFLGQVYELSARIKECPAARAALDVMVSPLYERSLAEPRSAFACILKLKMVGASDQSRSQWLKALESAEQNGIEPTHDALVSWLKDIGGISGAMKKMAGMKGAAERESGRTPQQTPSWKERLRQRIAEAGSSVNIAVSVDVAESDVEYVVVLVKLADDEGQGVQLGTISDSKTVKGVAEQWLRAEEQRSAAAHDAAILRA